MAEQALGQTGLADHGPKRARLDLVLHVMGGEGDELDLAADDTAIDPMASVHAAMECEPVRLDDLKEAAEGAS